MPVSLATLQKAAMPFWKAKAHDEHEGEGRRRQSFFDPSHISPERERRRFFGSAQANTSDSPFPVSILR